MTSLVLNPATNDITLYVNEGIPGSLTETGVQTLSNKTMQSSTFTGTTNINGAIKNTIVAVPALDINCGSGNYFTKTIAGNSTFTFSSVPSGAYSFTLEITHTSGTITWPSSVKWPSDVAPVMSTGKTHLFIFLTDDSGARWRAASLLSYTD
jgi:hypothetical protein